MGLRRIRGRRGAHAYGEALLGLPSQRLRDAVLQGGGFAPRLLDQVLHLQI